MTAKAQIEATFREEYGQVLAALISQLGDFDLAKDACAKTRSSGRISKKGWTSFQVSRSRGKRPDRF